MVFPLLVDDMRRKSRRPCARYERIAKREEPAAFVRNMSPWPSLKKRAAPPTPSTASDAGPGLRHTAILGSGLVALLVVGLGANAWMTRDVIQPGVSVGGVDVGGMSSAEARTCWRGEIGDRLGRPVQVRTAAGTVAVVPGSSGIAIDLDRALDEAYSTGRVEARLLPHLWSTQSTRRCSSPAPPSCPRQLAAPAGRAARRPPGREGRRLRARRRGVARCRRSTRPGAPRDRLAGSPASPTVDVPVQQLHPASPPRPRRPRWPAPSSCSPSPIPLRFKGKRVGRLTPKQLAPLLRAAPAGGAFALSIDPKGLAPLLKPAPRRSIAPRATPPSRPTASSRTSSPTGPA